MVMLEEKLNQLSKFKEWFKNHDLTVSNLEPIHLDISQNKSKLISMKTGDTRVKAGDHAKFRGNP